jgi:hypothetical protein
MKEQIGFIRLTVGTVAMDLVGQPGSQCRQSFCSRYFNII